MPISIFFCYAREDETLLNKLKTHLRPLQRQGLINVWHDRDISAGTEWEEQIKHHLNTAQIVLLLVSPDFMDSEYCYSIEMERALERHEGGEATVIPIILRHVFWHGGLFDKLQALPTDGKPVTDPDWHNLDRAFYDVIQGIHKVVQQVLTQKRLAEEQALREQEERQRLAQEQALREQEEHQRFAEEQALREQEERQRLAQEEQHNEKLKRIMAFIGALHAYGDDDQAVMDNYHLLNLSQREASDLFPEATKKRINLAGQRMHALDEFSQIFSSPLTLQATRENYQRLASPFQYKLVLPEKIAQQIKLVLDFTVACEREDDIAIITAFNAVRSSRFDRHIIFTSQDLERVKLAETRNDAIHQFRNYPPTNIVAAARSVEPFYNHLITPLTAKKLRVLRTLIGHTNFVSSVAISPDGQDLASGSWDNTIKVWELSTGKEILTLSGHADRFWSVAISPDGLTLVSGSHDSPIKVWELSTGKEVLTLSGHTDHVECVAISPDGQTLVSGSADYTIRIWELSTGKEVRTLIRHTDHVRSVAISPDGLTLISGSADHTIKVWELSTGKEVRTLIGHTNWVNSVAISPDGQTLVSGSADHTIKVWELSTGKEVRTLIGHTNWVNSVAISPDGQTLVSGSADQTIKIWELSTGKVTRTLTDHTDVVRSVAISLDGLTIVSGSNNCTIKVWGI